MATSAKTHLPFISVVIPAFNEEKYLPRCLKSLQNQTYPKNKFEVIVVDNNSKDKTSEIARSFGTKVVIEGKQGHVFALNRGMKEARHEIIATTDADTIVNRNWLNTIAQVFQDKKVVAVTGSAYYSSRSKTINYLGKISYNIYLNVHFALGKPSLSGINLAVRKSAFYKIKGLDTRYEIFSDVELGLRIKKIGKVIFCKELSVITSPRRWQKGSFEDYYKYISSYFNTMWFERPTIGNLAVHR